MTDAQPNRRTSTGPGDGSEPMKASNGIFQRLLLSHAVAWSALAVLGMFVASRSHVAIAEWIEPVRAEIPDWTRVGLGIAAGETLPRYALIVSPDVLRAARLLHPAAESPGSAHGHWWFDARLAVGGQFYDVEAQLPTGSQGLRVRFLDSDGPAGMQGIEFEYADPDDQLRSLATNAAAHDAGLLAVPSGLARLRINGSKSQLVRWNETNSAPMLQRLGYPQGEIFRLTNAPSSDPVGDPLPGTYRSTIDRRPSRAQTEGLRRLISLIRTEDEPKFQSEIGQVIDVEQVLAWSALAELFGGDATPPPPDWYFDPITGRLVPLVRTLVSSPADPEQSSDVHRLVARLLSQPDHRARRNQLLTRWVGVTRSGSLEAADHRMGSWISQLAARGAVIERATELPRLAQLRRTLRRTLDRRAESLRHELLGEALRGQETAGLRAGKQTLSIASWVDQSGLPFRIEGGTLVLPAGRHEIDRTLIVPITHRLIVEPGTRLAMAPGASLVTFRRIEAIGTRQAPIEIVAQDARKPWGTIGVVRAPGISRLAHVTVSGGSSARIEGIEFTGALAFNASDVVLRDSDVRNCHGDDAMSVRRATFQIERSRFIDNASDGLDAEWATGSVDRSLFANNGDDGLDLATSVVRVHRGWFRRMGDKALSAGERSTVTVTDSQLVDSQIAIASKEDSTVAVRGSEIRRNEIGISLYRDNLVFGSGYGTIDGGLFAENLRDFAVEPGSGLTLNGVERLRNDAAGLLIGLRDPLGAVISFP